MSLPPQIVSVNEDFFGYQEAIFAGSLKLISQAHEDKPLKKFLIILFRSAGFTQSKLAQSFSYSERHIRNIEKIFEKEGASSFWNKKRTGRPPKVGAKLIGHLIDTILELILGGTTPTTDLLQKRLEEKKVEISTRTLQKVISEYGLRPLFQIRLAQLSLPEEEMTLARTSFGGFWLLAPFLTELYKKTASFGKEVPHLLFTLILCSLCGMGHLFHLKDVEDKGFALLLGKMKVPDDSTIWKWMKKMSKDSVLKIYQLTRPLKDLGSSLWVSIDEHVVPRWTQAFKLKKAHHPTRGRKMKADKLFYVYELAKDLLLSLKVSSGKKKLSCHLLKMVKEILSIPGVDTLRIIFDAGGYKGSVFARLKAVKKVNFLTKAVRYSKMLTTNFCRKLVV